MLLQGGKKIGIISKGAKPVTESKRNMSVSCQQLFRKVDGDLKERSENNQFSIVPERSDEGNRMGDEEARRRSVTQKID